MDRDMNPKCKINNHDLSKTISATHQNINKKNGGKKGKM